MRSGNAGAVAGVPVAQVKPPADVLMGDFDALPAELRAVLREADLDWPTEPFLRALRSGAPVEGLVHRVRSFEADR